MASIRFQSIAHSYNPQAAQKQYALKHIHQTWESGKAYALLGPSGCGKTTLLNVISGLLAPSEGQVYFDDQEVTNLPPDKRNIAQVFQFPVIYDTMTVYQNLAFPLANRGFEKSKIHEIVHSVAEVLEIQWMLPRKAKKLTAEDKQKISMGRGLVRSDVSAILLDEALTVIDPHQKWLLRRKLKEIHHKFDHTMIYVTHDQSEAMTFADQIIVMNGGNILQVGTPQELFERPAHKFVGYFIGSPGMNFLPCTFEGNQLKFQSIALPVSDFQGPGTTTQLEVGIRPDHLRLSDSDQQGGHRVELLHVKDIGWHKIAKVQLLDQEIHVKVPEEQALSPDHCFLEFVPDAIRVYGDEKLIH